jgi:hypothetical protein
MKEADQKKVLDSIQAKYDAMKAQKLAAAWAEWIVAHPEDSEEGEKEAETEEPTNDEADGENDEADDEDDVDMEDMPVQRTRRWRRLYQKKRKHKEQKEEEEEGEDERQGESEERKGEAGPSGGPLTKKRKGLVLDLKTGGSNEWFLGSAPSASEHPGNESVKELSKRLWKESGALLDAWEKVAEEMEEGEDPDEADISSESSDMSSN